MLAGAAGASLSYPPYWTKMVIRVTRARIVGRYGGLRLLRPPASIASSRRWQSDAHRPPSRRRDRQRAARFPHHSWPATATMRGTGGPANQGGTEAPACSLIVRRRFAHHRSIAFSAARIASRLAPSIEPSRGLGGV